MLTAVATIAQMRGSYGDHMDLDDGGTWVMIAVMVLVAVAIVSAVIAASVFVARSAHPRETGAPVSSAVSARDVLDVRYARGEIDTVEYEERRRELG